MSFVIDIHRVLANMIAIYSFAVGAWSIVLYIRRIPPDANINGAIAIAAGLFFIEGLAGILVAFFGPPPARTIHYLYGVTIMLTLPAIFAFTRGRNSARESLLYGLGLLFVWGLSERAAFTATVAG
jgi:hypothetical protein